MQNQDITKLFQIILKWWWIIALLLIVTVGTMTFIVLTSEESYRSTVTLQISAPPPQEVPLFSQFGREALGQQIEATRQSLAEFLQKGDVAFRAIEILPEDIGMTGSELRERIEIDLPPDSQLVHLRVSADDPETAALLANTVVEVGRSLYAQLLAKPTAGVREFVLQELAEAEQKLVKAEKDLEQFRLEYKVVKLDQAIDDQNRLISTLRQTSDLAQADGQIAKVQEIQKILALREAELQEMITLLPLYNRLVDKVNQTRASTNFLVGKNTEGQTKENQILAMGWVQVITQARPPRRPLAVLSTQIILLGAIVSLIAGILFAILLEFLDGLGPKGSPTRPRRIEQPQVIASPNLKSRFSR